MIAEIVTESSIVAKLSLIVAVAPLVMGMVYALRPTDGRLALMRPLSLAGLFAGLSSLVLGLMNVLRMAVGRHPTLDYILPGLAEALIPLFVAFGCLTLGWLCVTLGLMREP